MQHSLMRQHLTNRQCPFSADLPIMARNAPPCGGGVRVFNQTTSYFFSGSIQSKTDNDYLWPKVALWYTHGLIGAWECVLITICIFTGTEYDNAVGRNDSMDLTIIFIKLITLIDPPVHMVALCVVSSPRDFFRIKALGSFTPGQQSRECVN